MPRGGPGAGAGARAGGEQWEEMKRSTSVYVKGLPDDASVAEVFRFFSKCGIIKQGEGDAPRVRFYTDGEGRRKGDGLVTFLKAPSVDLALTLLDGAPLRPGRAEPSVLEVSPAKFEMKGPKFIATDSKRKKPPAGGAGGGRGRKRLKGQERELAWDGSDDRAPAARVMVVLRGMFTPEEGGEPGFGPDLEADVLEECSKLGRVERVRVFVRHPDGLVTVRFHLPEEAQACVVRMQGRFFGGRQLEAALYDGFSNFWEESLPEAPLPSDPDAARRLESFARALEAPDAAPEEDAAGGGE